MARESEKGVTPAVCRGRDGSGVFGTIPKLEGTSVMIGRPVGGRAVAVWNGLDSSMPDAYCVVLSERKAASVERHFVGDIGKYGLLRALTGTWPVDEPRLSLGVVWYLPSGAAVLPLTGRRPAI